MDSSSNQKQPNQIMTDDLAFSAYLKFKGHQLIKSYQQGSKHLFTFELDRRNMQQLKIEFVNSDFIKYYNEVKNLKKIMA